MIREVVVLILDNDSMGVIVGIEMRWNIDEKIGWNF